MNRVYVIIFLALLLSGQGCSHNSGQDADIALLKGTVNRYVTLLAEGYKNLNMTSLQEVSTKKRATKAYYHMAALSEGKARMISHIIDLQFGRIKITAPDAADVVTTEKWQYKYVDEGTGREVLNNFIDYKLRYHLVKDAGRWLVEDIDVLESKQKDSQTLPFIRRPVVKE
jgi:hypothetical protein